MQNCEVHQAVHKYTTIFDLLSNSREITDVFSDLTKTLLLPFSRTPIKLSKRFNDFDLVSRSQVRIINCNLIFFFMNHCYRSLIIVRFLHTLKMIRHSTLCVTGVCLKDITRFLQCGTWMWVIWAFALLVCLFLPF